MQPQPPSPVMTEKAASEAPSSALILTKTEHPPSKPKPAPKAPAPWWVTFRLLFNTYRKLFTTVCLLNALWLILASTGHFNYAIQHSGAMVLGNLLFSVMVRNEVCVRALFIVCNTLFRPRWTPLWLRESISSILQHLGGVHTGCAMSGIAWLIWRIVHLFLASWWSGPVVCIFGIFCFIVLGLVIVLALPTVRERTHNVFEKSHRFFGWTALLLTWAFVLLGTQFTVPTGKWAPSTRTIIQAQEFWYLILMTIFIALPWTMTRLVPVEIELPPAGKVCIIKLKRGMSGGLLGRISRTAILEYHLFGLISEGPHADCHYIVAGIQGDFTKALVDNPPKYLWTRELKFPHVSHTSPMYRRGVRVCTGTGVGSGMSTCLQSPDWFFIWIGSDFRKTYGDTIVDLVERCIPEERRILWDSKVAGRPDTVALLAETYEAWNAEVVFVTSNYQGNKEMMEGCKLRGIPCFGTLWDF